MSLAITQIEQALNDCGFIKSLEFPAGEGEILQWAALKNVLPLV